MNGRVPRTVSPEGGERGRLTEMDHLLAFGEAARLPQGGFGWLNDSGLPTVGHPRMLYVTCRMTYVYAIGTLLGRPGAAELVDHGLAALEGTFADRDNGGWFTSVDAHTAAPVATSKWAYPHAFVVLAAAAAAIAQRPGADTLLESATTTLRERFWDDEHGMLVDEYDQDFTVRSDYRGLNAVMHGTEALLAAADATGQESWAQMAERMIERVVAAAAAHEWRLPEHYDDQWRPQLEVHRERPADPFKPYGATPGHALEWARLLLHAESGAAGREELVAAAEHLFAAAMRDAWSADGLPGLVYTTDWAGSPVIRQRLHWVLCEAIGAATALHQRTGASRYQQWSERLWSHADRDMLDRARGSWMHELDARLRPATTIRPGKADLYHAVQACLLPSLPLKRSVIAAVAATGTALSTSS